MVTRPKEINQWAFINSLFYSKYLLSVYSGPGTREPMMNKKDVVSTPSEFTHDERFQLPKNLTSLSREFARCAKECTDLCFLEEVAFLLI